MATGKAIPNKDKIPNLSGAMFGRLTVLSQAPNQITKTRPAGFRAWNCRCECGVERVILQSSLIAGRSKSCGRCNWVDPGRGKEWHGLTMREGKETPEYKAWRHAKARCHNPKDAKYPAYGGRGISMCKEWADSFSAFFKDMGQKPAAKHSLDRIDVDGNYEPANCRWATPHEQMNNMRKNIRISYAGRVWGLEELCRYIGVLTSTVHTKRRRTGLSYLEAILSITPRTASRADRPKSAEASS